MFPCCCPPSPLIWHGYSKHWHMHTPPDTGTLLTHSTRCCCTHAPCQTLVHTYSARHWRTPHALCQTLVHSPCTPLDAVALLTHSAGHWCTHTLPDPGTLLTLDVTTTAMTCNIVRLHHHALRLCAPLTLLAPLPPHPALTPSTHNTMMTTITT